MLDEKNAQEHLYALQLSYLVFVNYGKEINWFFTVSTSKYDLGKDKKGMFSVPFYVVIEIM
jgi:hypothetical protein